MAEYLYMSIIFRTFVANNKAYDRGRVNQGNTAEAAAFGTGRKSGFGI